jgi:hypothetical protein
MAAWITMRWSSPFYGGCRGEIKAIAPCPCGGLRRPSVAAPASDRRCGTITINEGENVMSKSQDSKKNVKKVPTKTPKEKKEAKRLKKAERKY